MKNIYFPKISPNPILNIQLKFITLKSTDIIYMFLYGKTADQREKPSKLYPEINK